MKSCFPSRPNAPFWQKNCACHSRKEKSQMCCSEYHVAVLLLKTTDLFNCCSLRECCESVKGPTRDACASRRIGRQLGAFAPLSQPQFDTVFKNAPRAPSHKSCPGFPNILQDMPMQLSEKALNDLPSLLQELCRVSQRTPNQLIKGPKIFEWIPGKFPEGFSSVPQGFPRGFPGNSRHWPGEFPEIH